MPSLLRRLTAWLCLATALLTGLAPAQGFVLCLEADGCMRVETEARDTDCGSCEGHESGELAQSALANPLDGPNCSCTDIAVPGCRQEQRLLQKSVEIQLRSWIALPLDPLAQPCLAAGLPVRAPRRDDPRPPAALALIRSVVLLL